MDTAHTVISECLLFFDGKGKARELGLHTYMHAYVYLRKLHIRRTGYYHSYSYALIDIIQALLHEHHHQAIQVIQLQ